MSYTDDTHSERTATMQTTIEQDIDAMAAQIGVDPSAVEFMANHVASTMGDAMLAEEDETAQVEMMRAGVESSRRAMQSLCTKAMTRSGDAQRVAYDILKGRAQV